MADDWFRSADWSAQAQEDFEARLRRARPGNRTQYARIKGLALWESGQLDDARSLWWRILEHEDGHDFERASTLEHLADSYVESDPAAAQACYRRLLTEHPTLNGTTATAEIALAELVVDKGDPAGMEEALALLSSFLERDTARFPSVLFRWHLALIRAAEATGEEETVRRAAHTALDLAAQSPAAQSPGAQGPAYPRHPQVGVVHADAETLRRLRRLAT